MLSKQQRRVNEGAGALLFNISEVALQLFASVGFGNRRLLSLLPGCTVRELQRVNRACANAVRKYAQRHGLPLTGETCCRYEFPAQTRPVFAPWVRPPKTISIASSPSRDAFGIPVEGLVASPAVARSDQILFRHPVDADRPLFRALINESVIVGCAHITLGWYIIITMRSEDRMEGCRLILFDTVSRRRREQPAAGANAYVCVERLGDCRVLLCRWDEATGSFVLELGTFTFDADTETVSHTVEPVESWGALNGQVSKIVSTRDRTYILLKDPSGSPTNPREFAVDKIVAWAHPGGFCPPAAQSINSMTLTQLLESGLIGPGAPGTVTEPSLMSISAMASPDGNLMLLGRYSNNRNNIIVLRHDCVLLYAVDCDVEAPCDISCISGRNYVLARRGLYEFR